MEDYWKILAYERRSLSNCESEPIQFCGAIQGCGWFLSMDEKGRIAAASENCAQLFEKTIEEILEKPLGDFLTFKNGEVINLEEAVRQTQGRSLPVVTFRDPSTVYCGTFNKSKQGFISVDIEVSSDKEIPHFVEQLSKLIQDVEIENDIENILQAAVVQIKDLTQFDRVMIYRFEPNWDGYVIAEVADPKLNSFQGLYYPAKDIPEQARKLYMESKYRMIVDALELPVPVHTRRGLGRSELDMSGTSLRAVSPFHIQYLKNMGVRSSFAVPLRVNGKLWGLIACHHYDQVKYLPREVRSSMEVAGQVISGRLSDQVSARRLKSRNEILSLSQSIITSVADGGTAISAFKEFSSQVMEIARSSGLYFEMGGESLTVGEVPSMVYLAEIREKLRATDSLTLWHSEDVATEFNLKPDPKGVGALAVPLSFGFEDVIIWFRPEFIREVKWGGQPFEKPSGDTLSPRESFEIWTQKVQGRSREWNEADQEAAQFMLFTFVKGIFHKAAELSKVNKELSKLTQAKDEFIGMISHELRTPLGVMIGWIDILRDRGSTDPDFIQALDIIDRNAKLQINLINDLLDVSRIISGKMRVNPRENTAIEDIVKDVARDLGPTAQTKSIIVQTVINSPIAATVDPERIRQIVWNLLANAIKFTPKGGIIQVMLEKQSSSYQIIVRDNGIGIESIQLSRIFDRFTQAKEGHAAIGGLGLGLSISKALVELHGGNISAFSEGKDRGSTFVASFPIFNLKSTANLPKPETPQPITSQDLKGLRVLIAEDQVDAARALEITLSKMGAKVDVAHDGDAAYLKLTQNAYDLLISDIGMPGLDGYMLIEKWRRMEKDRRVEPLPAIALTAFATVNDRIRSLDAGYQSHLPKPVERAELLAVIKSVAQRRK